MTLHVAYVSRHSGTSIEINHDLHRSLQIFSMLQRSIQTLTEGLNLLYSSIFVISFIDKFVFRVQFYHEVPLHVNITM